MRSPSPEVMLDDCETYAVANDNDVFNDWELEFIDSVSSQVADGRDLSESQEDVIHRCWKKLPVAARTFI